MENRIAALNDGGTGSTTYVLLFGPYTSLDLEMLMQCLCMIVTMLIPSIDTVIPGSQS
jgi:hypothetical protein